MLAISVAGGCGTISYYRQALDGQIEIFRKQQANEAIIGDENTESSLREKLSLIGELRRFAETELSLPAGKNYTKYADLGREYVVWSVFAAPEFSLEAKEWWYPVVGRLSYRGFFEEEMAKADAENLEEEGYDVYVGGVDAYSTLGWFSDPVLNTFVEDPDTRLAELVFHELTHRQLYIPGKTDYNEAMATAVAEEGVIRWLKSKGQLEMLSSYKRTLRNRRQVYALIEAARHDLRELYARAEEMPEEQLRARKAAVFEGLESDYARLRRTWGENAPGSKWLAEDLNNAHLNAVATYHRLVPMFQKLISDNGGDLEAFFKEAESEGKAFKGASNGASEPQLEVRPTD